MDIPIIAVSTCGARPEACKEAIFTPCAEGEKINLLFAKEVKRTFSLSYLCEQTKKIKGKYLSFYLPDFGTIKLLSNDYRKMIRKMCEWWKDFKKEMKERGKSVRARQKAPTYKRHQKWQQTAFNC